MVNLILCLKIFNAYSTFPSSSSGTYYPILPLDLSRKISLDADNFDFEAKFERSTLGTIFESCMCNFQSILSELRELLAVPVDLCVKGSTFFLHLLLCSSAASVTH